MASNKNLPPAAPAFTLARPTIPGAERLWIVTFSDGRVIWCETATLHSLPRFRRAVRDQLGIDYPRVSRAEWFERLAAAMEG
jgi:hypothetical protein